MRFSKKASTEFVASGAGIGAIGIRGHGGMAAGNREAQVCWSHTKQIADGR